MSVKIHGSNQESYRREAHRVSCDMYLPCPICFKCRVKASHLYLKCQRCEIPFCRHSEKDRNFMIRRDNFAIKQSELGPDAIEGFRNLGRKAQAMDQGLGENWLSCDGDDICACDEAAAETVAGPVTITYAEGEADGADAN